jgi:hypothetical protein
MSMSDEMFKAICKLGLGGIVSKKLDAPYKSGPSKAWLKIKNPKAPAATRAADGTLVTVQKDAWQVLWFCQARRKSDGGGMKFVARPSHSLLYRFGDGWL